VTVLGIEFGVFARSCFFDSAVLEKKRLLPRY